MKHIYKREPLQRSLPSNYSKLDAVNYLNLSGFKGLQVYDNPLIAEQQSTYSCKNVYVDEHGNLTLRPALMPVSDIHCCWQHAFSDGTTIYAVIASDGYSLHIADASITVPNLNNIALESNGRKYLFTQQSNNVLYDITDGQFTQVTGVVLLDDPENTDMSHYNILNSNVQHEYSGRVVSNVMPESEYTIEYSIPLSIDITRPYKIQQLNNNITVICGHNRIIIANNKLLFDVPVETGFQRDSSDWCIQLKDNAIEITVASVNEDPQASEDFPASGTVGMYFKGGIVRRFLVSSSGKVTEMYTATIHGGGVFAGYGHVIVLTIDGSAVDQYGNYGYGIFSRQLIDDVLIESLSDYDSHWVKADIDEAFYPVNMRRAYRNAPGYYGRIVSHMNGYLYMYRDPSVDAPLQYIRNFDYAGKRYADGSVITYPTNSTGERFSIFDDVLLTESAHVYRLDQTAGSLETGKLYDYNTMGNISFIHPEQKVTELTYLGMYSIVGTSVYEQLYGTTVTTEYTFETAPLFATDTMLVHGDDPLLLSYRQPKLLSSIVDRDTSIIPVLSDINEKVITGFFLDNCWWFITEHSIFGTGVDGNGLHTVERFDPLKYFKVSERITGAIRVSDTSFWVFHSQGAYLIYKTALTLSDGTEYRWLYTATAKSKGCDFENGLFTLPVSNNVATVTSADICAVTMKENIQSDERSLVPITTQASALVREALQQTDSIKIFNHQYNTVFCLNPMVKTGRVPALVYSNITSSWWYWEFPVDRIYSIRETEDYAILYCSVAEQMQALRLTADEYYYNLGVLQYEVYADRVTDDITQFVQIEWHWQSAVQLFTTLERRKQLLFTTFIFDDYAPDTTAEQTIEIGYHFDIYSREYATSVPDASTIPVYRVTNAPCRTLIGSYNYLQLNIYNREFEDTNFEVLTKPKVCCISMKYRILRGEL